MQRVLLVEDNALIARLVRALLEQRGFSVALANSAEQGLRKLDAALTLVVVDIELPGRDGFSFVRELRAQVGHGTKVVALSAHDDPESRARFLDEGGDAYFTKPVDTLHFGDQIERVVRARPGTRTIQRPTPQTT